MKLASSQDEPLESRPTTLSALLLRHADSLLADELERGLWAAGVRVTAVPSVYDAVVEGERAGAAFDYLILGVDRFGKDEFALVPFARREWPHTAIAAYHSPGFRYKASLAELMGADHILADADDIQGFLEGLSPEGPATWGPAPALTAEEAAFLAASAADRAEVIAPEAPTPPQPGAGPSAPTRTPREAPDREIKPATAPRAAAPSTGDTGEADEPVELTEDELRILLGEEEIA